MRTKKRRSFRHRPVRPGTAPGTISIDVNSPLPEIEVIQYTADHLSRIHNVAPLDFPKLSRETVTWINVVGLGDKKIVKQVAAAFDIHDLALEDVVNTHQRPKVERYADHLYVVLKMPSRGEAIELEQISLFIGENYVLSWQERAADCFDPIRKRIESPARMLRSRGNDFLAYSLIDAIIDSYFPLLNQYSDILDEIEDDLASTKTPYQLLQRLHHVRSDIRSLRRSVWSHRDVIAGLISYDGQLLTDETRFHLRDVADHTLRLVELMESSRDSCSDLQDLYLSTVSLRMNEVMKVLTIIATIFMPLGFIAGLYGMNFSHDASPWNMPETDWYFGYPMALAIMIGVAVGMLFYFRRLGWIGNRS
jgi:magnesium transporter